jgi:hypothetical protein
MAEGRVDRAVHDEQPAQEDQQHEPVHRHAVVQVDEAEQLAARNALQAILAAGELHLQRQEEHQLCEAERDHREVDACAPDRQAAEDRPEQRAEAGTREQPEFGRGADLLAQPAGDVGRTAEERGVAEGQQAGVAEQQIECAGEQREAQDLHQERGIDHERCDRADEGHAEEEMPGRGFPGGRDDGFHASLPFKPACRTALRGGAAER